MPASAQQFLDIEEIRDGTIILPGRSIRGIMMISSMNFALKADDEQEAIIYQFQSFLNSLDFSIQVVIQSRHLNITGYLDHLKNLEARQTNELLKNQTEEYRRFVETMIKGGAILSKNFFVVVPFTLIEALPAADQKRKGLFSHNPKVVGKLSDEEFNRMKIQLWQRMEFVALGLRRVGLHITPLGTEELIELLWSWYHPEEAEVGYYPELPPELLGQTKIDTL